MKCTGVNRFSSVRLANSVGLDTATLCNSFGNCLFADGSITAPCFAVAPCILWVVQANAGSSGNCYERDK